MNEKIIRTLIFILRELNDDEVFEIKRQVEKELAKRGYRKNED